MDLHRIIVALRRRLTPGLSIKLTANFVAFGFIIGYLSFIIVTSASSQKTIEAAASTLIPLLQDLAEVQSGQLVDSIIGREHAGLARLFHYFKTHSHTEYGDMRTSIFFERRGERAWKRLVHSGKIFRSRPAEPGIARSLDVAARHNFHTTARFFTGQSDHVSFFVKVPLRDRAYSYVLMFELDRQGTLAFISNNIRHFALFSAVLLAVSLLLGKLFSYRIVSPIRALSETASRRAAGETGETFVLDRGDEIGTLSRSLNTMANTIDDHVREIEQRMRVIETMNMIDKAVLSSISRADLLDRVMGIVSSLLHSTSIALALYNPERRGFDILSMYHDTTRGMLAERPFVSLAELDRGHAENISRLYQFTCPHDDAGEPAIYAHCCGQVLNVPIALGEAYLGSLIIGTEAGNDFPREVRESAALLADQVGVALQSVKAFEEKERLLLGILLALTRSIDAKSKWTSGHSERVARYAEAIGIKMGLHDEDLRALTFSAILHDIGKIAVPESILDKPARLTDEEYAVIKTHPREGARIIADIPSYDRITPGVLHHHEHWNGSGYPDGLCGDAIPLSSRIITVADVYDAITAERPYRKGMGPEEARDFILKNREILFDPAIVALFLSFIDENTPADQERAGGK